MVLSVDVSLSKVDNLGPKALAGVREFLFEGAQKGHAVAMHHVPVDRATLRMNLAAGDPAMASGGNRIVWGVTDIDYARAMEFGTGPIPNLPITPLLEWGERVLGSREAGAGAWHKIREEGVDAHAYMRPGREAQVSYYRSHSIQKFLDRNVE